MRASLSGVVFDDLKDHWREADADELVHPKSELLRTLMERQGYLCAWVGENIGSNDGADAHIDHVKPQDPFAELALDPENMVAAWPKNADPTRPWGAHRRGNWWHADMVRPNDRSCETRLRYSVSGSIASRRPDDEVAKDTISKFGLDHAVLRELRRSTIVGFRRRREWRADIQRLSARMNTQRPGQLPRFAPPIVDALGRQGNDQ